MAFCRDSKRTKSATSGDRRREGCGKTHLLVFKRRPQPTGRHIPNASLSIRTGRNDNSVSSNVDELNALDRLALLVSLESSDNLRLDEVNYSDASFRSAHDGQVARRVDSQRGDAVLEVESTVVRPEGLDRRTRSRVPLDQGRVGRGREKLLAWRSKVKKSARGRRRQERTERDTPSADHATAETVSVCPAKTCMVFPDGTVDVKTGRGGRVKLAALGRSWSRETYAATSTQSSRLLRQREQHP
jgi:hypothetical protein